MAAYDWPMSILIIHILLIWLIIRVLIPNFCGRVCRCFGHRRVTRGGHRKKRPEDRSNPNENYHHSDKAGWNRHYDHSADFESSLKSRFRQTMHTSEKLAQKRGNREEEFHHYTAKMSHIRPHEGKRSHSGPGSQSVKNNHFNCILNLWWYLDNLMVCSMVVPEGLDLADCATVLSNYEFRTYLLAPRNNMLFAECDPSCKCFVQSTLN